MPKEAVTQRYETTSPRDYKKRAVRMMLRTGATAQANAYHQTHIQTFLLLAAVELLEEINHKMTDPSSIRVVVDQEDVVPIKANLFGGPEKPETKRTREVTVEPRARGGKVPRKENEPGHIFKYGTDEDFLVLASPEFVKMVKEARQRRGLSLSAMCREADMIRSTVTKILEGRYSNPALVRKLEEWLNKNSESTSEVDTA